MAVSSIEQSRRYRRSIAVCREGRILETAFFSRADLSCSATVASWIGVESAISKQRPRAVSPPSRSMDIIKRERSFRTIINAALMAIRRKPGRNLERPSNLMEMDKSFEHRVLQGVFRVLPVSRQCVVPFGKVARNAVGRALRKRPDSLWLRLVTDQTPNGQQHVSLARRGSRWLATNCVRLLASKFLRNLTVAPCRPNPDLVTGGRRCSLLLAHDKWLCGSSKHHNQQESTYIFLWQLRCEDYRGVVDVSVDQKLLRATLIDREVSSVTNDYSGL